MIIYCFKCKQKTETLAGVELKSSKDRNMIKGTCSICGTKKSVFLSSTATKHQGKGFDLNSIQFRYLHAPTYKLSRWRARRTQKT